jgi:RecG-like helicase
MRCMGIRDAFKRLGSSTTELEAERLQSRFETVPCSPIASCESRQLLRVGGEVKRMRTVPRSGAPSFEVVVSDGTADLTAVFTGRREIAGITHGRSVIFEGVAHDERGRLVLLNPAYTLLSHA